MPMPCRTRDQGRGAPRRAARAGKWGKQGWERFDGTWVEMKDSLEEAQRVLGPAAMEERLGEAMGQAREVAESRQRARGWKREAPVQMRAQRAARLRGCARAAAAALTRAPPGRGAWRPELAPWGRRGIWVRQSDRDRVAQGARRVGVRRAEQEAVARLTHQAAAAKAEVRRWEGEQRRLVREGLVKEADLDDLDRRYREVCRFMKQGG